jgi:putative tryptophan/tyrosine transport system substrate-binding protein
VSDPVASGLVSNLAKPDGSVTGFSTYEFSLAGKWLQLLKDVVPSIARVTLMFNPATALGLTVPDKLLALADELIE